MYPVLRCIVVVAQQLEIVVFVTVEHYI